MRLVSKIMHNKELKEVWNWDSSRKLNQRRSLEEGRRIGVCCEEVFCRQLKNRCVRCIDMHVLGSFLSSAFNFNFQTVCGSMDHTDRLRRFICINLQYFYNDNFKFKYVDYKNIIMLEENIEYARYLYLFFMINSTTNSPN